MGRSGFWSLLLWVPWVQIVALLWLGLAKSKPDQQNKWPRKRRHSAAQILMLLILPLALSRAFWAPFSTPSGHMKPTLLIGDYVIASRLKTTQAPMRGDVVVFLHPVNQKMHSSRVVGLPSDVIEISNGQLVLNGVPVPTMQISDFIEVKEQQGPLRGIPYCLNEPTPIGGDCVKETFEEELPSGRQYAVLNIANSRMDNTPEFRVPDGHVFLLGDNRDNSMDSRVSHLSGGPGYVPIENLIGRLDLIAVSTPGPSYGAFWNWRKDRFFKPVN